MNRSRLDCQPLSPGLDLREFRPATTIASRAILALPARVRLIARTRALLFILIDFIFISAAKWPPQHCAMGLTDLIEFTIVQSQCVSSDFILSGSIDNHKVIKVIKVSKIWKQNSISSLICSLERRSLLPSSSFSCLFASRSDRSFVSHRPTDSRPILLALFSC